ncbi:MAG: methyltransferase [Christensenellales bacterium]
MKRPAYSHEKELCLNIIIHTPTANTSDVSPTCSWENAGVETDAGVFSKQHIDPGSEILCKSLPELHGRVLDMGCGWGAMTVMTLSRFASRWKCTMAGVNERALDLDPQCAENGMQASCAFRRLATSKASLTRLSQPADPRGQGRGLSDVRRCQRTRRRRHSGAGYPQAAGAERLKYLKELYAEAETIERDGGYWVIACRK